MDVYINLNNQRDRKRSKKALRIFSVITLCLAIATAVIIFFGILESTLFLLWFYLFYFLIFSISLYMQSNGKHPFDLLGKSYFKIDDSGVEIKLGIFSKKVIKFRWDDMEDVKIKLFEIIVKSDNHWESIDLEKLSDDNLKVVKKAFLDTQEKQPDREVVYA